MGSAGADTGAPARDLVGVLGGTFDPVHSGHLHVCEQIRLVFDLPRILLMPCSIPPHKSAQGMSPARHRLAMLQVAVKDHEGLEVSTLELDRGGVSYTIHTLRTLREGPPARSPLLILGVDSLLEIETWFEHAALLEEFDLIAANRPGFRLPPPSSTLGRALSDRTVAVPCAERAALDLPGEPLGTGGRIYLVPIPPAPVSSTEVRRLAASGASLEGLVPAPVARYIHQWRLYQREEAR